MHPITLTVPPALERDFKRLAKRMFPREAWALLLGTIAGDHAHADEMYVPEDLERYSGTYYVGEPAHWFLEANEQARESGLVIVSRLHSHPYTHRELRGALASDRAQSEADQDSPGARFLTAGICVVQQMQDKRLRASIRYWGPTIPLILKRPRPGTS